MKIHKNNTIIVVLLLLILYSCSTRKTTWSRRVYHQTTTRYNVNFNGYLSLETGVDELKRQFVDDYSEVLPMFPFHLEEREFDQEKSNTSTSASTERKSSTLQNLGTQQQNNRPLPFQNNASTPFSTRESSMSRNQARTTTKLNYTGSFGRAAEKAKKAIQDHSLKKKPKKNYRKYNLNPQYRSFYNQNEYNPELHKSWLLLGYAQFYQGDFMHAVGTFSFIAKKYIKQPEVAITALIWKARAYTELGWYMEAAAILEEVNNNEFPESLSNLYNKQLSHNLLSERKYREAIPALIETIETEKERKSKHRYLFILAQIYQALGEKDLAFEHYNKLLKQMPQYELALHTRIKCTEVMSAEDGDMIRKEMKRLLRKHRDDKYTYLVYHAIGNIEYNQGQYDQAIANYTSSIEYNTEDDPLAGLSALSIAQLYEKQGEYREAADYYLAAEELIPNTSSRKKELTQKADIYNYFADVYDRVNSLSSSGEAMLTSSHTAAQLVGKHGNKSTRYNPLENKRGRKRVAQEEQQELNAWYFYNPALVEQGKIRFAQKWGKSAWGMQDENNFSAYAQQEQEGREDTITELSPLEHTKEAQQNNNELVGQGVNIKQNAAQLESNLYKLAYSYQYDILDYPKAIETFQRIETEFRQSDQLGSAYYALYLLGQDVNDPNLQQEYRSKLLNNYSNTRFDYLLTDPNYLGKVAQLEAQEDAAYKQIFQHYVWDEARETASKAKQYRQRYPDSEMTPQILYMEAIAEGKLGNMDLFTQNLTDIIHAYADNDISPVAMDVLALFKEKGVTPLPAGSELGLASRRDQRIKELKQAISYQRLGNPKEEIKDKLFSYTPYEDHYFGIHTNDTTNASNELLYATASMNFSKFIAKQFELIKVSLRTPNDVVLVGSFSNHKDALDYGAILTRDSLTQAWLKQSNHTLYTISANNLKVLRAYKNSDDYICFYKQYYLGIDNPCPQDTGKQEKPAPKPLELADDIVYKVDSLEGESILEFPIELTEPTIETIDTSSMPPIEQLPVPITPVIPELTPPTTPIDTTTSTKVLEDTAIEVKPIEIQPIDNTPIYKGVYEIKDDVTHYYGIVCLEGKPNLPALMVAVAQFVHKNYPGSNIGVREMKTTSDFSLVLIGDLSGKDVGLDFLRKIVKEQAVKDALKDCEYRNTVISKDNVSHLLETKNLDLYTEFFKVLYLKR